MIIGREQEIQLLKDCYNDEYSQFVVVYGRRRVGKTFLVRETFNYKFTFQHSGISNAPKQIQLSEWQKSLEAGGLKVTEPIGNWFDAFTQLARLINKSRSKRKVLFIDELPWMDTQGSRFVSALEHFWNSYCTARKDIMLIVCGSATSWIVNKIVHNHGGLHNRINQRINLKPFSLHECEQYAKARHLPWQRRQLLECYMVMGGIPYYWSLLKKGFSVAQNIDRLFFDADGELRDEFSALYNSLFRKPDNYLTVITALGKKKAGLTRKEILEATGLEDNGNLSTVLKDLEHCGFIRQYNQIGRSVKEALYQLIDFYTLFFFKNIDDNRRGDESSWSKAVGSSKYNNWCGLAFERVCLAHSRQIKYALSIGGVATTEYSWIAPHNADQPGVQIDLLIDRADHAINLCEIKYCATEYLIDQDEEHKLLARRERFIRDTGTDKAIYPTLITTKGVTQNSHSDIIQNVVTADDLFAK